MGKGIKGKEGEGRLFTTIVATPIALQSRSQQPPPPSPTPYNPGGPCKGMESKMVPRYATLISEFWLRGLNFALAYITV